MTKMKDLKISKKIKRAFILINALYILGIIALVFSYMMSNDRLNNMIDVAVTPEVVIGDMNDAILNERVAAEQMVLFDSGSDEYALTKDRFDELHEDSLTLMNDYSKVSYDKAGKKIADDVKTYYEDVYYPYISSLVEFAGQNDTKAATQLISSSRDITDTMDAKLMEASDLIDKRIEYYIGNAEFGMIRLFIITGLVFVIVMYFVVSILIYMNRLISKRLEKLTEAADRLSIGDLNVDIVDDSKDEIGQLSNSFLKIVKGINEQSETFERVAGGDLTVKIDPRSASDTMNIALQKMIDSLNEMTSQIMVNSANVFSGSKQIDSGAQLLAQGSSEQASSMDQLSGSIADVARIAEENSAKAIQASELIDDVDGNSVEGTRQMEKMSQAVRDISAATQSINIVINTIEDIAFQTNILALNAAVEAARAGQHGKGFAVVADEVRNLAAKSAEAAKDTSSLIKNTMDKADSGSEIAGETVKSFEQIASGISESARLLNDIAELSEKQKTSIEDINQNIEQVAAVVQQNSSTAEESAASSEQLSSQAEMLKSLSDQFKVKKDINE